jgi:CARDB
MARGCAACAACAVLVALCSGSALAAPARPDLVVNALTASQHGATLVVAHTVRNRGPAPAPRSTVGYFLGATRIGASVAPALQRGASRRASVRLAIPASVASGSYRLRACADVANRVAEASESNNCRTAVGAIAVPDRTPPAFAGLVSAVTCIPGPSGGPTRTSSYRLTWTAATDEGTPSAGIVYDVYQANAPGGEDFTAPTYTTGPGAVSFGTPLLPDDRAYYFVVRARDRAGNRDRNLVESRGTNLCL